MHSQVTCGCTTRYTTRAAPRYCCCTAACSTSTSSSANCYPGNSTTRQPPRRPPETRSSTGLDESPCGVDHDFTTRPPAQYVYLLGLYLGDGCISRFPRTWRLRVTCDTQYPTIIARCREAIDTLMPNPHADTR